MRIVTDETLVDVGDGVGVRLEEGDAGNGEEHVLAWHPSESPWGVDRKSDGPSR